MSTLALRPGYFRFTPRGFSLLETGFTAILSVSKVHMFIPKQ